MVHAAVCDIRGGGGPGYVKGGGLPNPTPGGGSDGRIVEMATAVARVAERVVKKPIFCEECGNKFVEQAKFCNHCGGRCECASVISCNTQAVHTPETNKQT